MVYNLFFAAFAAVVCLTGSGHARNPMAVAGCPFRKVLEQHLAAGTVAAHHIHAGGQLNDCGTAVVGDASRQVVEGDAKPFGVVEHTAVDADALGHRRGIQAGRAYGFQGGKVFPDVGRLVASSDSTGT